MNSHQHYQVHLRSKMEKANRVLLNCVKPTLLLLSRVALLLISISCYENATWLQSKKRQSINVWSASRHRSFQARMKRRKQASIKHNIIVDKSIDTQISFLSCIKQNCRKIWQKNPTQHTLPCLSSSSWLFVPDHHKHSTWFEQVRFHQVFQA